MTLKFNPYSNNYTKDPPNETKLRVLLGCEESQAVTKAFRALGHEAYSCDVQECSGGRPDWHIQGDVMKAIMNVDDPWDIIILHPPCTALAVSGNRWYGYGMPEHQKRGHALAWTRDLWNIAKQYALVGVALENPVGVLSKHPDFGKPQYVQPWQFGHGETKKTGLWLHNLPPLEPTNIVEGREQRIWKMGPSPDRAKLRSKTFQGLAEAMALQWGGNYALDIQTDMFDSAFEIEADKLTKQGAVICG